MKFFGFMWAVGRGSPGPTPRGWVVFRAVHLLPLARVTMTSVTRMMRMSMSYFGLSRESRSAIQVPSLI